MGDVRIDTTELDELADDLIDSIDRAMDVTVAVTKRGAQNIKDGAVERVSAALSARSHLPHYPRSIDYDITESGMQVEAEIGPNRAKPQGGRGLGVELGSRNAPPIPHLFPAFEDEETRYLEQLAMRVGEVVL